MKLIPLGSALAVALAFGVVFLQNNQQPAPIKTTSQNNSVAEVKARLVQAVDTQELDALARLEAKMDGYFGYTTCIG